MNTFRDLFHEFLMMNDWTKLLLEGKLPRDRKRMTNDTRVPLFSLLLQHNNRFVTRSCM